TQNLTSLYLPSQGMQVYGIINNISPEARQLGIPKLHAETSTNVAIGIGARPFKNFNFTIDYYQIKVADRIVLGDQVVTKFGNVAWFENSFDSRTSGLDVVMNYGTIGLG